MAVADRPVVLDVEGEVDALLQLHHQLPRLAALVVHLLDQSEQVLRAPQVHVTQAIVLLLGTPLGHPVCR